MSQVQRQPCRRGFDVCLCAGFVGGFEAGPDEHGADAETVVGGEYGEDVEDWWKGLVEGRFEGKRVDVVSSREAGRL